MTSVSVSVLKTWPSCCSCCLSGEVVFDDAVVHDDDVALAIAVRVGVLFGGAAVGGPAGVADAEGAIDRIHPDGLFEIAQFALARRMARSPSSQ